MTLTPPQKALLARLTLGPEAESVLRTIVGGDRPGRTTASLLRQGWVISKHGGTFEISAKGRQVLEEASTFEEVAAGVASLPPSAVGLRPDLVASLPDPLPRVQDVGSLGVRASSQEPLSERLAAEEGGVDLGGEVAAMDLARGDDLVEEVEAVVVHEPSYSSIILASARTLDFDEDDPVVIRRFWKAYSEDRANPEHRREQARRRYEAEKPKKKRKETS